MKKRNKRLVLCFVDYQVKNQVALETGRFVSGLVWDKAYEDVAGRIQQRIFPIKHWIHQSMKKILVKPKTGDRIEP